MEVIVRMTKVNPWTNLLKWDKCFDYVSSYWTRSGSRYTGLTNDQARSLEEKLRYAPGTLDPSSAFWDTFAIRIGKKDVIINTDTPEGELKYNFLKNHKLVANGVANISPRTDYVIIDKDLEATKQNAANKIKREAYRAFDKMTLDDMRKCLRLFGVKSDTLSNELVEAKLNENIEKDPDKFMRIWVENADKEYAFIVEEALSKNIIRKNRNTYYFGTDVIGNGIDDTIAYLKDKKNQDLLLAIKGELQSK